METTDFARCPSPVALITWALLPSLLLPAGLRPQEPARPKEQAAAPAETPAETPARAKTLATFPQARIPVEKWMEENGWKSARDDPSRFEVGDGLLHLVSKGDSVMIGTRSGFPLDPRQWQRLRMLLRVERNPLGADLSKTSLDDAAFRLYIAFDRGGGILSPPNTLAYTWTEGLVAGTVIQSAHYKQVRYLSVGCGVAAASSEKVAPQKPGEGGKKAEEPSGWVTVERDLLEDYRRAFPEDKKDVPSMTGIVLKCDSNNTKTSAEAWLSVLELHPPRK